MIEYKKKDKNGEEIVIRIKEDIGVYYKSVDCIVYKEKEVNYILFKKNKLHPVYLEYKSLSDVNKWGCKGFESWVDNALDNYNNKISQKENDDRVLDIIKGGCK